MEEIVETSEELLTDNVGLELSESAKKFLKETAKWAYFLSILGYVFIGIILLLAVFWGALFAFIGNLSPEMNKVGLFGGSFFTAIYLIIAALYFFPVYYLNRFASNAKTALKQSNTESLEKSFEYLKSHYKYIGIMAIITLCFYGLIFLCVFVVALTVGLNS